MSRFSKATTLQIPAEAYSRARHVGFTFESFVLNGLGLILPKSMRQEFPRTEKLMQVARTALLDLLHKDAERIGQGVYPISVLEPENPFKHLRRIPRLLWDGLSVALRRGGGKTRTFNEDAKNLLQELPRYYQRNFHFQTDGYLTRKSAEIYEHQVEVLFAGAADAMRRLIISPMRTSLAEKLRDNPTGRGLVFLEVAAGTGRTTRFVRLAFPEAKIVVLDLSDPYLQIAREKLARFGRLDFVQGDVTALPFQDATFDAVYSVFLFHELPLEERKRALLEISRVLKKGGFHGLVDSLQKHDLPDLNSFLETFPKNYHEPFYRNYTETPMEGLLEERGLGQITTELGFLSKVIGSRKND